MDNYKDEGGHAFPVTNENYVQGEWEAGMTLRDYFAAKVIASVIDNIPSGVAMGVSHPEVNLGVARAAYAIADAMIKAREE